MSYFTTEETVQIQRGVSLFFRMIGLFAHPKQGPYIAEEQDLLAALDSAKYAAELTRRMIGKQKYQGVDFNPAASIMQDMMSFLMFGATEDESVALRRRNRPMYYLVIEPVVQVLAKYPHEEILDLAEPIIDEVIEMVRACVDYGDEADALRAQAEVRALVNERETQRREALDAKKKKPRRTARSALIAVLNGVDISGEVDD